MKKLKLKLDVAYDGLEVALQCAYESLVEYVKIHQGTDGFLMVNGEEYDRMSALVWIESLNEYRDDTVVALRVKDDRLEIIYDLPRINWSTEDVANCYDEVWTDIQNDDLIDYRFTLFSILDALEG